MATADPDHLPLWPDTGPVFSAFDTLFDAALTVEPGLGSGVPASAVTLALVGGLCLLALPGLCAALSRATG